MGRRIEKSIIPADLEGVLAEDEFNLIFKYLESEFHLSKKWRIDFHSELMKIKREENSSEFFVRYMIKYIEPSLQQLLKRDGKTIFAIIRYLLRERIERKHRAKWKCKIFIRTRVNNLIQTLWKTRKSIC